MEHIRFSLLPILLLSITAVVSLQHGKLDGVHNSDLRTYLSARNSAGQDNLNLDRHRKASYNRGFFSWPVYFRMMQRRRNKKPQEESVLQTREADGERRSAPKRIKLIRWPHLFLTPKWVPGKRSHFQARNRHIKYSEISSPTTDDNPEQEVSSGEKETRNVHLSSSDGKWYWPFYWPNFKPVSWYNAHSRHQKPIKSSNRSMTTKQYQMSVLNHWPFHGFSNLLATRNYKYGKRELGEEELENLIYQMESRNLPVILKSKSKTAKIPMDGQKRSIFSYSWGPSGLYWKNLESALEALANEEHDDILSAENLATDNAE